jgi:hypothetical protein
MKYLEILKERDLNIENLPKVLQKKIQTLDFHYNELKQLESDEELDEAELEDIEIVKQKIDELDSHIAHKVKIFDQVKYDEKLAKISQMSKGKKDNKQEEEIVEVVKVVKEVVEPIDKVEEPQTQPQTQPQPQPQPQAKQPIENKPQVPEYTQPQVPEYEEEEFERVAEGKPKKMTTGLILMGVGAFFLTWGAVNFFKSRR